MKKTIFILILVFLHLDDLHAARNFTVENTAGNFVNYYMRDTVAITLRVTNTNTGANTTESINRVRFRFPSGMIINTTGHIAPAGWSWSIDIQNNRITFTSGNQTYNIVTNNFKDFVISLNVQPANTDIVENLSEVRVRYSPGNNTVTKNNLTNVSWARRGLKIISMLASPEILNSGDPFTLTISVQNLSLVTQSNITANPNPPAETSTGGFDPSTTSNPIIPSLGVLATANLVYNYTTLASDEGTVYFTCNVRNGNNNTTGISTNSNTVYIGRFKVVISYDIPCPLTEEKINVVMTVTNNNPYSLTNVTPYLSTHGTASLVRLSGPVPATIPILNSGNTATFSYIYQISGSYNDTFYFSGYAIGTKTTPPPGIRQTPIYTTNTGYLREYEINLGPNKVSSGVRNYFLTFTLQNKANNACPVDSNYNINSLITKIPTGFVYDINNFSYMIGNSILDPNDPNFEYFSDNWTISSSLNNISFISNGNSYNLPVNKNAYFSLYINETPKVISHTIFTFKTSVTNEKGIQVDFDNTNVQIEVSAQPFGITDKPTPTKGGFKEKHN